VDSGGGRHRRAAAVASSAGLFGAPRQLVRSGSERLCYSATRACLRRTHHIKGIVMADSKTKRGGADRALIALGQSYEVAYWSKKLKVTPAKLRYAVKKVGHSAKKVAAYIALQKHRARDKKLIALSQAYEVCYWTKKFKVSPARLKAAVAAVGHSSAKVAVYLGKAKKTKAKKTKAKKTKARKAKRMTKTSSARKRKART
jgi:hypothetical protein